MINRIPQVLLNTVPDLVPKQILQQAVNAEQKWAKLILEALQKNSYVRDKAPKILAKVSN